MIRKLQYDDFKAASDVLWKSFYAAEKNIHSMKGMETFRDLTSPVSLSISDFDGSAEYFGFFQDDFLAAVGAVKEKKHILMLYVLPEMQGQGIGKKLLEFLVDFCTENIVTLRSSDGAVTFYEKFGFVSSGPREVLDELVGTPMKKEKK